MNWALAGGLVLGAALDALLGDPRRGHPVAVFGAGAAELEKLDYADSRARGAAHAAACVAAVALPAALLQRYTKGWSRLAAVAAVTWTVTGARSLTRIADSAADSLAAGDLRAAREILPSLCGRDPSGLGETQIARAVIESVAENTSDAVVAPLLWGAVAGLPGLAVYRAINTLDAMVGHKSPRYLSFGWASARLDDAANWLPARATALLTVLAAARPGELEPAKAAWQTVRRDGGQHPSPNAGRCEAAFAGALGVRLGGTNVYHGVAESRPGLGNGRAPQAADIGRAVRLSRAVTVAASLTAAALALALPRKARARTAQGPRKDRAGSPRRRPAIAERAVVTRCAGR